MDEEIKHYICNTLGFPSIPLPWDYLGVIIHSSKLKSTDCPKFLTKLGKYLNGWKQKLLLFAGHIQLVKSTIWNLLYYWFRSTKLPKRLRKKITSNIYNFIHNNSSAHKINLISWSSTTKPKHVGGLGIPNIDNLNVMSKLRLIWRLYDSSTDFISTYLLMKGSIWKKDSSKHFFFLENP